jgi:hypothetical protein
MRAGQPIDLGHMRSFFVLILAIGALWAIDVFAFHGRYSQFIWQQAKFQGRQFEYQVNRTLDRFMPGR